MTRNSVEKKIAKVINTIINENYSCDQLYDDADSYDDGEGMTTHLFIYQTNAAYNKIKAKIDEIDAKLEDLYDASICIDENDDCFEPDDDVYMTLLIEYSDN